MPFKNNCDSVTVTIALLKSSLKGSNTTRYDIAIPSQPVVKSVNSLKKASKIHTLWPQEHAKSSRFDAVFRHYHTCNVFRKNSTSLSFEGFFVTKCPF